MHLVSFGSSFGSVLDRLQSLPLFRHEESLDLRPSTYDIINKAEDICAKQL